MFLNLREPPISFTADDGTVFEAVEIAAPAHSTHRTNKPTFCVKESKAKKAVMHTECKYTNVYMCADWARHLAKKHNQK